MGDQLERGIVMMDPEAYKQLILNRFPNIAAVPTIDADMLQYLFTEDEIKWLKAERQST